MSIYFKLYESDGITFRYTFPYVQETNAPQTVKKFTEIKGLRGDGSIVIKGSDDSWDLIVRCILTGENYDEITQKIDILESALEFAQPYILKIDKEEGGATVYSYRIKRLSPIEYPSSLRTDSQEAIIRLKANSW